MVIINFLTDFRSYTNPIWLTFYTISTMIKILSHYISICFQENFLLKPNFASGILQVFFKARLLLFLLLKPRITLQNFSIRKNKYVFFLVNGFVGSSFPIWLFVKMNSDRQKRPNATVKMRYYFETIPFAETLQFVFIYKASECQDRQKYPVKIKKSN